MEEELVIGKADKGNHAVMRHRHSYDEKIRDITRKNTFSFPQYVKEVDKNQ